MMHIFRDSRFIHQLWFACISLYLFAMPAIEMVALLAIFKIFREIALIRKQILNRDFGRMGAYRDPEFEKWLDERHNRGKGSIYKLDVETDSTLNKL